MEFDRVWRGLPGVALCMLLPAAIFPQEAKKPDAPQNQARQPSAKPVLAEATRVSTDEAVKNAAKKLPEAPAARNPAEESPDSAVTELHPVKDNSESSDGAKGETAETGNKSRARNIHGSVYGTAGQGTDSSRRAGGSLGASSKSGKTSVYVETNRARETQGTSR